MMPELLRRRAWWWSVASLAWMLLMFWLSSRSDLPAPGRLPEWLPLDKLAHLVLFGILGALLYLAGLRPALAVLAAALYGLSDEIHQMYVPGRSPEVLDWIADILGAGLGVWFMRLLTRRAAPSDRVE